MYLGEFKSYNKKAFGWYWTSIPRTSSCVFVMRRILLTKGLLQAHSVVDKKINFIPNHHFLQILLCFFCYISKPSIEACPNTCLTLTSAQLHQNIKHQTSNYVGHVMVSRQFEMSYGLPAGARAEDVESSLGRLVVRMNRPIREQLEGRGREVPIVIHNWKYW